MIYNPREAARVRNLVLLIAAVAWVLLIAEPRGGALAHCGAIDISAGSFPASLSMLLAMNTLTAVVSGWMLMLAAMMLPVLTQPIYYVYLRSFAHRRLRSIAFFLGGYGVVWMAAGVVLLLIEMWIRLIFAHSYLPSVVMFLVAVVWQVSPTKQVSLNRCHAPAKLSAFGVAADISALRFGMVHGIWCVSSCWAWMLWAMLAPMYHLGAMAAVTVLLCCEKLEEPELPSWRVRGLGKATRILIAQMRIRIHGNGLWSTAWRGRFT